MKSVVRWSPKLKPGKQPGKDDIVECKEQLPLSRFVAIVASGVLILIGMGAILAIRVALPKKGVTHKLDAAEQVVQSMPPDTFAVESKPANPDLPARPTSGESPSLPTQVLAIEGLPGSSYRPPLTRKQALRRFVAESDARGRRFQSQLSVVARKPGSAPDSKNEWPKAFIRYLEAHRDYLRAILTHGAATTPNPKSRHRGSDSFLASVQGLSKPLK